MLSHSAYPAEQKLEKVAELSAKWDTKHPSSVLLFQWVVDGMQEWDTVHPCNALGVGCSTSEECTGV